jgi:beta propeller repeat protein
MKISMWAVWVAILSLFFSISYGFDICADPNIQTTPAISGTTVVWADSRTGIANIYCKYLNEPNDFALSPSSNPQLNPDIDGNIVVWVEDGDIFGYDLSNSSRLEVCIDASTKETPAISGNLVVWAENNNGNYDIYGKYIGSGGKFLICGETGNQIEPAADGSIVIWRDARNGNDDIYGKNLSNGQSIAICTNPSNQAKPKISGLLVVWQDYRAKSSTGTDIYGCYLQQSDFAICTVANNQNYPDVCDDIVVWKDGDNIYYSDLSKDWNGTGYISYAITTGSNTMANPHISNYTVIWENQSVKNIYGAFVLSSDTATLNITNPQAGQLIWNGKPFNIQWQADPNLIGVVNLEISVNGEQYRPIATNILNTGSYEWMPEESIASETCRIKVAAVAGHSANAESGIFTIAKCNDKLTADFNGDCTVDTADFAAFSAQWLECGNPYDGNCVK